MIALRALEDIATLSETVDIEYKLAAGELPADFWATYSAFANTHSGVVLLGVKEKQGQFSLHGIEEPRRIITNPFNQLNNPKKVSVNLLSESDVAVGYRYWLLNDLIYSVFATLVICSYLLSKQS